MLEAQRVGRSGRATIVYDLISRGALEIGCAQVQPSAQEPLFSANFPSVRLLRSKRDVALVGKKLVERQSLEAFCIALPTSGVGRQNPNPQRRQQALSTDPAVVLRPHTPWQSEPCQQFVKPLALAAICFRGPHPPPRNT